MGLLATAWWSDAAVNPQERRAWVLIGDLRRACYAPGFPDKLWIYLRLKDRHPGRGPDEIAKKLAALGPDAVGPYLSGDSI